MNNVDLDKAQKSLEARGLCDIKFFFTGGVSSTPNSDVTNEIAYVLNTYERGDRVPLEPFGDSAK